MACRTHPLALLLLLLICRSSSAARLVDSLDSDGGNLSLGGLLEQREGPVKRALLVAFTYKSGSKLSGTCYDLQHMADFAFRQGYTEVGYVTDGCSDVEGATLLRKKSNKISQKHMSKAFSWLLEGTTQGDSLLFHYSGHGESIKHKPQAGDIAKDECNGRDEALSMPNGESYLDDDIFHDLVERVPAGAHLLAIVDACHSGTVLDLPWNWMHQKYYWTCPDDPSGRRANQKQFEWEWAQSPESLGRTYPLPGTVAFISGSQNTQTSGDAIMTTFTDRNGKTQTIGGLLTFRLVLDHWDWADKAGINTKQTPNPPILDTALSEGWTYAQMMQELVAQVTGGDLTRVGGTKQIPNFCASDSLDMDAPFSLDGSAFPTEPRAAKDKCPKGLWQKKKDKLKVC